MKTKIVIYRIVDCANGGCYVGSSKEHKRRWALHRTMLKAGNHPSSPLQNTFDSSGLTGLRFEIIERCSEKARTRRERYWIKYLRSFALGYNAVSDPATSLLSPEALARRGESIRRALNRDPQILRKRAKQIAKSNRSPESLRKRRETWLQNWADPAFRRKCQENGRRLSQFRPKVVSNEARKKLSLAGKRRAKDPKYVALLGNMSRENWARNPLTKAQRGVRSENLRRYFSDPANRALRSRQTLRGIRNKRS
jgi:group I intron endonuclease